MSEPIKLEEGKSYHIKTKFSFDPKLKVHIDKIIKNPCYEPYENEIDGVNDLIVYRVWSKRKGWIWDVTMYLSLCILNEWKYRKK